MTVSNFIGASMTDFSPPPSARVLPPPSIRVSPPPPPSIQATPPHHPSHAMHLHVHTATCQVRVISQDTRITNFFFCLSRIRTPARPHPCMHPCRPPAAVPTAYQQTPQVFLSFFLLTLAAFTATTTTQISTSAALIATIMVHTCQVSIIL